MTEAAEIKSNQEKMTEFPDITIVEGPFDPNGIIVSQTDRTIKHTPEIDGYIDMVWQEEALNHPERKFTNRPKVLLLNYYIKQGNLNLEVGKTNYKEKMTTGRKDFIQRFGYESVALTLGVTGLIKTADNKLVIGQLQTHHERKGGVHVIGGLVEPEDITSEPPYLEKAIMREIEEEVGIEENEWQLDKFLGVVDSKTERSIDVIFLANTQLTEKEIHNRKTDQEVSVKFIPDTVGDVRKTLLNFLKTATDQGIGALFLYGKQEFGSEWSQFIVERIERRTNVYQRLNEEQNKRAKKKITTRVSRL